MKRLVATPISMAIVLMMVACAANNKTLTARHGAGGSVAVAASAVANDINAILGTAYHLTKNNRTLLNQILAVDGMAVNPSEADDEAKIKAADTDSQKTPKKIELQAIQHAKSFDVSFTLIMDKIGTVKLTAKAVSPNEKKKTSLTIDSGCQSLLSGYSFAASCNHAGCGQLILFVTKNLKGSMTPVDASSTSTADSVATLAPAVSGAESEDSGDLAPTTEASATAATLIRGQASATAVVVLSAKPLTKPSDTSSFQIQYIPLSSTDSALTAFKKVSMAETDDDTVLSQQAAVTAKITAENLTCSDDSTAATVKAASGAQLGNTAATDATAIAATEAAAASAMAAEAAGTMPPPVSLDPAANTSTKKAN